MHTQLFNLLFLKEFIFLNYIISIPGKYTLRETEGERERERLRLQLFLELGTAMVPELFLLYVALKVINYSVKTVQV